MIKKSLKYIFLWLIIIFLLMTLFVLFLFVYYSRDLPRPEKFTERTITKPTKIYDRTGEVLLYEIYGEEKREFVDFEKLPDHLFQAILAVEDDNFYDHRGIDLGGIFRSLYQNITKGKIVSGGSTITQQLIRTTFLTPERTFERKIKEIILAIEVERHYSKDQIIEWYLNQIALGPNIYGMETASQYYFAKSASDLSLPESAVLASLIKAPSSLGQNKEILLQRKDYAIDRMVRENYLKAEKAEQYKEEEISFTSKSQLIKAPHFVINVQKYLLQKYGRDFLEQKGLKVYTSLDWQLQEKAKKAILHNEEKIKNYNAHNAGLVALDPKNGEILAMVGSKNWFDEPYPPNCVSGKDCLFDPKVNVTLYGGGRQPGSALKPLFYALAFEKGYNEETILVDEKTNFGIYGGKPYIPKNYDNRFRGEVTLKESLAQSLNVPSVKVLAYLLGQEYGIKNLKRFGLTTFDKPAHFYGLSIILGGGEVKLLELTNAYSAFANKGFLPEIQNILKIEDNQGDVLEQKNSLPQKIISSQVAEKITNILSDNEARSPAFGKNSIMHFKNHKVAAKTGTTNEFRDAWIIGYTPSLVVGVWVGNNDNTAMTGPGVAVAGPIWRTFMEEINL